MAYALHYQGLFRVVSEASKLSCIVAHKLSGL
jgi:hypothetical protein